jgi:formylglycine-generating enzyme required for sulfatase activity
MGDPSVVGNVALDDFPSPRLVVLAPFFIDIDELSVGEARRWLREHDLNWSRSDDPDPVPWSEDEDYTLAVDHHCTLPGDLDDPSRDSLPVNCLSHARAQAICASRDGDLPTEAQLEYVAGELEGASHAWRDQPPSCSEAVFARGGTRSFFQSFPDSCLEPTSSGGVKPIGWGTRDRVDVGGVDVRGLAGNVAELARDRWSRQSASACWDFFLKDNPICDAPDDGEGGSSWVVRSGSWPWPSYTLDAAFRAEARLDFEDTKTRSKLGPHVGFRCARDE